jgi:SAM-dependent MidA family methyltransferase
VKALRELIGEEIRRSGPIPFSRYMELCLYHPEFGYYSRNASQFGKAGDFYTSSDVHAVFGRLLARQFEEIWRVFGSPNVMTVVELGPGRGLFAQDVLDWSEKTFPEFFRALRYLLVERSAALRSRITQVLSRHLGSGKATVVHQRPSFSEGQQMVADELSPTIVFANEFFDAIPVEVLSSKGSLRIDCRAGQFVETWVPASTEELQFLDLYSVPPQEDERIEVAMQSQQILSAVSEITLGVAIIVDYGYTREEQLAGRHRGTIKAIRQHSVSGSPYEAPGEQDITCDVNFTALDAVGRKKGMQSQKLRTQSQFLMGIGEANQFADAFEGCRLPQERAKVALQLKHLVTPAGMGESFHVSVASKGVDTCKLSSLAGMSFGHR